MFRKIILYILILSILAPAMAQFPAGLKTVFAKECTDYTDADGNSGTLCQGLDIAGEGESTTFEYKKKRNDGYEATIKEETGSNGYTDVTETWTDGDGNTHERKGKKNEDGSISYLSETTTSKDGVPIQNEDLSSPCAIWKWFSKNCINWIAANILYALVFTPTNFLTKVAASMFNASIAFSLNGEAFENDMIETGWETMRDLINLFFIFIVLYIAISTILQVGNFQAKSMLIKVIVAAVLVNFSLLMTKVIIDASHVFAWEFYNKINITNNGKYPEIPDSIKVSQDFKTKDIAGVFMAGFNPQRLIGKSDDTDGNFDTFANKSVQKGDTLIANLWQVIIVMLMASVINLVAAFVLFAGGVLFIIRIVVLWFLMILSPVAFLGSITPSSEISGQVKRWWKELMSQAFFAPAFLFLFYLVTELINSDFLKGMIEGANSAPEASILFLDVGSTIIVVFHLMVIGGLLVGCLILAKSMGAHGSGMVMNWGKTAGNWARNKVGDKAALRWGGKGAGLAKRYVGEKTRSSIAPLSESFLESNSRMARFARVIPGVNRMAGSMGAAAREDIGSYNKELGNLSNIALKRRAAMPTVSSTEREAIVKILAGRNDLSEVGGFNQGLITEAAARLSSKRDDISAIENLQWQYAAPAPGPGGASSATTDATIATSTQAARTAAINTRRINASVAERLNLHNYFDIPNGQAGYDPGIYGTNNNVRRAMYGSFDGNVANAIWNRQDDAGNRFFRNLHADLASSGFGRGLTTQNNLINWLETDPALGGLGNRKLAAWARSAPGANILSSNGFT